MKKQCKKLMSLFLAFCMMTSLFPTALAFGSNSNTEKSAINISADTSNTITVKEGQEPDPVGDSSLQLSALDFTIQRDYEQSCMITVQNTSDETKMFYLEATNSYNDLSMEIIKSGSEGSPAIIAAGGTAQVELTVFAQNAKQEQYTVPVSAYILSGDKYIEDAKGNVNLTCNLPSLNLTWNPISSNESTLKKAYRITNNGDTLTDLSVAASDSIKDYLSFSPAIANYELPSNESIEFEVWPDLAKMKSDNVSRLSGSLIASCAGKTAEHECVFDTEGKEITVTTMGQLALKQDENPFTKFEVIEESILFQYRNGDQVYTISEDTTTDDLLDDNNLFDLTLQCDVDLGIENEVQFDFGLNSSLINADESASTDLSTKVVESDDGSISIATYTLLTATEYQNMIDEALSDVDTTNIARTANTLTLRANNISEEEEKFLLENTIRINGGLRLIDRGSSAVSVLGNLYKIKCLVDTAEASYDVANDPRLTKEQKLCYLSASVMKTILTGGGAVVSLYNPAIGFAFSLMTLPLNTLLDQYQNELLNEAYAAYYAEINGRQCTNRGKVTAQFYVPDYGASGNSKPSMHTTSRMYGDGYVDRTNTNYDITLNDKSAGTVSNTGLTDVTMAEIPTDDLKPGANTVEFDYDTNPGSHFVVTDTQITLVYPNDTEIGYIGMPDELQDVRTKPDFCVYPENIYTSDDLIVGEASKLKFNVYNRGSRGGWFTVTCHEGSNEIFREENYYLAAFSSHTFEMDWTPSTDNSTIRVELTNTSVNLEERSTANNSATKTVTARQREIPDIRTLNSGVVNEDTPFSVTVDVYNYMDITNAEFTLDETTAPSNIKISDNGSYRRYWLSFDEGLSSGSHSINAAVTYQTSSGEAVASEALTLDIQRIVPSADVYSNTFVYGEKLKFAVMNIKNLTKTEVSIGGESSFIVGPETTYSDKNEYSVDLTNYNAGELDVLIKMYYFGAGDTETVVGHSEKITLFSESDSYFAFSLADTITSPSFSVYGNSYDIDCKFEHVSDENYRCLKTVDMIYRPSDYTMITSYNTGVIVTNMSESGQTINDAGCNQLSFEKPENTEISSAVISNISGIGDLDCYVNIPISTDTPIVLTPGKYAVTLEGTIDGVSFYDTIEKDLTSGNQTINIADCVLIYYFEVLNPDSDGYYNAMLCCHNHNETYDYWSTEYLNSPFEENSNILKCSTSYSWIISQMKDSDEAYIAIYSDKELFFVQIKGNTQDTSMPQTEGAGLEADYIKLDKSNLNQVTLVCDDTSWSIGNVNVQWNDLAVDLYGNTLYLPDGEYSFSTVLLSDSREIISKTAATITEDCELKVDQDLSNFRDVTVSWSDTFSTTGTVQCSTESGSNVIDYNFTSGNAFKAEDGGRTFYLELMYLDDLFEIIRDFEVSEENHQLTIGNQFAGSIYSYFYDEYDAGETINISINDASDNYGNCLSNVYAYDTPLCGTAIFTDVNDEDKTFSIPITATSLNWIDITLPEVGGTYSLYVELTAGEESTSHTVTFDSQGGSVVEPATVHNGDKITKPADPTCKSYSFGGWYKEPSCSNVWDFETDIVSENITLYARWIPTSNAVTVTFDSQGGSPVENRTVASGETISRPDDPTRAGYTFADWYTSDEYTQIYDFNTPITSDITLYAKWLYNTVTNPTGVSLDKHDASLTGNSTLQLTATVLPDNATDKSVSWTSSDTHVAIVSDTGLVTSVGKGTTTITVKSLSSPDISDSCTITVSNPVTSITLNPITLDLAKGQTSTIRAVLQGALAGNVDDTSVSWSSSDTNVVSVDDSGNITAVSGGQAIITANVGDLHATCTVTVTNPATSVSLDKTETSISGKDTVQLTATVLPDNATNKSVSWTSSNPNVAIVSDTGLVTPVGKGTATITATSVSTPNISGNCTVTVSNPVTSITFNPITLNLVKGQTNAIKAVLKGVLAGNVDDTSVSWSSNDTNVATVDSSGNVKAISTGQTTITASVGNLHAICTVTVTNPANSVTLSNSNIQATVGDAAFILTATVNPTDADGSVSWQSSNPKVATVSSDGTVEIVSTGQTTITAKIGDASATCSITVSAKQIATTATESDYNADVEVTDSSSAKNLEDIISDKGDVHLVVQLPEKLTDAVLNVLYKLEAAGVTVAEVVDVFLQGSQGQIAISANDGVTMTVRLKMTEAVRALDPSTLQVVYVSDDGTTEDKQTWVEGDEVCFITEHFSKYIVTGKEYQEQGGKDNDAGDAEGSDETNSNSLTQTPTPNNMKVGGGLSVTGDSTIDLLLAIGGIALLSVIVALLASRKKNRKQ